MKCKTSSKPEKPDFLDHIKHPMLDRPLPADFQPKEEAEHLDALWKRNLQFRKYRYVGFVDAGRSGMVFKVIDDRDASWAMIIVRRKIYCAETESGTKGALSPATESELRELQEWASPHPVGFKEAIQDKKGIVAIVSIRPPPSGKLVMPECSC